MGGGHPTTNILAHLTVGTTVLNHITSDCTHPLYNYYLDLKSDFYTHINSLFSDYNSIDKLFFTIGNWELPV